MTLYAFDGTWNSVTLDDNVEQENETNVANFSEAYADEKKWYVPSPGTRFGKVGRILGGTTGMGGLQRVREAYSQLCKDWEAGNRISISWASAEGRRFRSSLSKRRRLENKKGSAIAIDKVKLSSRTTSHG